MKKSVFSFLVLYLACSSLFAQYTPVPMDTAVRYGHLPNGLTYYIRHNALPAHRGEFYIVQNVGAILENDQQAGLAHFLEHMAFNGTKHFPGKGIINYMESIGAQFGTNLNAYTSLDETVYMMRDIPLIRPTVVDSAILVLHDWSNCISLQDDEIDKERGVIREEWRTGNTANRRMWTESNKQKYPNSQYAKRDVIGDTAVINNFPHDTLRAYYHKWYRPDQQCIIAVGDFNADSTLEILKKTFVDIPTPVNPAKRINYGIPNNEKPIVSIVTDPEARNSMIGLEIKRPIDSETFRLSEQGYMQSLIENFITDMLDERLSKMTRLKNCPFVDEYVYNTTISRQNNAFAIGVVAKETLEKDALRSLLTEVERLKRFGFTQSELNRAKANMLSRFEKSYNERSKQKNEPLVKEYTRSFLDKEPIPGIAWEYQYAQKALDSRIDLQVINKQIPNLLTDKNIIFDLNGPAKKEVNLPSKDETLNTYASVFTSSITPYSDKVIDKPLVKRMPKAGTIIKEDKITQLDNATEWTLSNGIKVIIKPTNFKNDEIILHAFSDGGYSLVNNEELPSAVMSDDIIANNGLASFNREDLNNLLAGKEVNVAPYINRYGEGVKGNSTIKDFATLMQLTYLTFTSPRKDNEAYNSYMTSIRTALVNAQNDPKHIYQDSLTIISNNHSPRVLTISNVLLDKVRQDKALKIYKQRMNNPADFTFLIVGSVNIDSIKPFILTYIGGLKTNKNKETWKDDNVRHPNGLSINRYAKNMKVERTSVYELIWGGMPYNLTNIVNMDALADIMDIRYTASLREDEGGTYGAHVYANVTDCPQEQATLSIRFDTNPKQSDKLIKITINELDSVSINGPLAIDLDKVKKNLNKQLDEQLKENGWWTSAIKTYEKDGINYTTDMRKAVNDLSIESVKQTAKALLANHNRTEIVQEPKQ